MEWISTKDRLPEIPSNRNFISVLVAWGDKPENVSCMYFEKRVVRGRVIKSFKWNNRLTPWEITDWMPLPAPPAKPQPTDNVQLSKAHAAEVHNK